MAITAKLVKDLREMTGAGMMDCKKALVENDGDLKASAEFLQIKGLAKAAKKSDRVAAEGLVATAISADGSRAALIEVNCETDFVARNDDFIAFVNDLATHAVAANTEDVAAFSATAFAGETVADAVKAKIATIGENINVRRIAQIDAAGGGIGSYVHNGNIGVVVVFSGSGAGNAAVADLGRDIAMHIAAMNPLVVRDSEISDQLVEDQTRIETEKAVESGKPRDIAEKMVIGRIAKWKREICLLNQPFVKNPDLKIEDEVQRVAGEIGGELRLDSFARMVRGEGIEKKDGPSLADEVAGIVG